MSIAERQTAPEGKEYPPITHPHFVLLLGVSGVGKSTILKELTQKDPRFRLNTVWTNRALRDGEIGKKQISDHAIDTLGKFGLLLADDTVCGNRYVIRSDEVRNSLCTQKIPMQDYPISLIPRIRQSGIPILSIYIAPPGLEEWKERLSEDGRDTFGDRFQSGLEELRELSGNGYKDERVDEVVINDRLEVAVGRTQSLIYRYVSRPSVLG